MNQAQKDTQYFDKAVRIIGGLSLLIDNSYGVISLNFKRQNKAGEIANMEKSFHFLKAGGIFYPQPNPNNGSLSLEDFVYNLSVGLGDDTGLQVELLFAVFPETELPDGSRGFLEDPQEAYEWIVSNGELYPSLESTKSWGNLAVAPGFEFLFDEAPTGPEIDGLPEHLIHMDMNKKGFNDPVHTLRSGKDLNDFFGRIFAWAPEGNHMLTAITTSFDGAYHDHYATLSKMQTGIDFNVSVIKMIEALNLALQKGQTINFQVLSFPHRSPKDGFEINKALKEPQEIRGWILSSEGIYGLSAPEAIAVFCFDSDARTGSLPEPHEQHCDAWV